MELIIYDLRIPVEKDGVAEYLKAASQRLNIGENDIKLSKILGKLLDISNKERF